MRRRPARLTALVFFGLYLLAVTWPGATLLNRTRPLVLGLPLNLFWIALWVAGSGLVLCWLYLEDQAHGRER